MLFKFSFFLVDFNRRESPEIKLRVLSLNWLRVFSRIIKTIPKMPARYINIQCLFILSILRR